MNKFSKALGTKFELSKDILRIRTFELNGHTFKVKVPLTVETDAISQRTKNLDETKLEAYYKELSQDFINNKQDIDGKVDEVVFTENDVIVKGRSLREAAKNKLLMETRVLEMFKLLVPEEATFDMSTLTYDMIEELFPFTIQMQILELISDTISPSYKETKGK
jgi:6-pyruvoyl-tetrahydropterin synthase